MPVDPQRSAYFDRVRPILGDAFLGKRILAFGVSAYPKALEALVRSGVFEVFVENEGPLSASLLRAWGASYEGMHAAEALLQTSRDHNHFEERFAIQEMPTQPPRADLLLAYAPHRATEILSLARSLATPAIVLSIPSAAAAAQCVWVYDPSQDSPHADELAALLDTLPAEDPRLLRRREDFLEGADLMLGFAKAILTRKTSYQRHDLEALWSQHRSVVLRGSPHWPWQTDYLTPLGALQQLSQPVLRSDTQLPESIFHKQRVLVLGCGTSSLLVDELAREVGSLLLLDTKPFSIFNPIRQLCSTRDVNETPKPFVLQQILARRIAPDADWQATQDGDIHWLCGPRLRIGAAELKLSEYEPESITRFERLLDTFSPTLSIVGMGRSRDDNFTACELLRARKLKHIVPTAFPAVTHFKHIVVDGAAGPCYDCLQNQLPVDGGAGPRLDEEARSVYYGGTQPASLAETYPSAHSLYRLARALMLPNAARPAWWAPLRDEERCCLVGANRVEETAGSWLYGCSLPGQMVAYGPEDVVLTRRGARCRCGRTLGERRT
jgi:hypothetical protein